MRLHEARVGEDLLVRLEEHRVRRALEPPAPSRASSTGAASAPASRSGTWAPCRSRANQSAYVGMCAATRNVCAVNSSAMRSWSSIGPVADCGSIERSRAAIVVAAQVDRIRRGARSAPRRPRPTPGRRARRRSPPRCAGCGTRGPRRAGGTARWSRCAGSPTPSSSICDLLLVDLRVARRTSPRPAGGSPAACTSDP